MPFKAYTLCAQLCCSNFSCQDVCEPCCLDRLECTGRIVNCQASGATGVIASSHRPRRCHIVNCQAAACPESSQDRISQLFSLRGLAGRVVQSCFSDGRGCPADVGGRNWWSKPACLAGLHGLLPQRTLGTPTRRTLGAITWENPWDANSREPLGHTLGENPWDTSSGETSGH